MKRVSKSKAVALGVLGGSVVLAVVAGLTYVLDASSTPRTMVLILTAPSEDGAEEARFAYLVDLDSDAPRVEVLDPLQRLSTYGSSGDRLRDVYTFGGGEAVAEALAEDRHTGRIAYMSLPIETWTAALGGQGVDVEVPEDMNLFLDDKLYSFARGERRLSGEQAAALLIGVESMEPEARRRSIRTEVAARVAKRLLGDPRSVSRFSESREADTSMGPMALARLGERIRKAGVKVELAH